MTRIRTVRSRSVPGFLATLALVLVVRCDDNTISGPRPQRIDPTPTPIPPPASDLSGSWTGTSRERGATEDFFCPGITSNVTAQVSQNGSVVSLVISPYTSCSARGLVRLDGTLAGTLLAGTLRKEMSMSSCVLTGLASGPAEPSRIVLDGHLHGGCDAVLVHIELQR
jgi:hypothetical protein